MPGQPGAAPCAQERGGGRPHHDPGTAEARERVAPVGGRQAPLRAPGQVAQLHPLHHGVHRLFPGDAEAARRRIGGSPPGDQAGAGPRQRLEREGPGGLPEPGGPRVAEGELPARLGVVEPPKHERPARIEVEHLEAIAARIGGEHVADLKVGESGVQLARAAGSAVVEEVDRVEARAPAAHLREPWPDPLGRGVHRHLLGGLGTGIRQQVVPGKGRPAEVALDAPEQRTAHEPGPGADHGEVAAEAPPGGRVGGVNANLDLDTGATGRAGRDPERPGHPHVPGRGEGGERLRVLDVDEGDVRPPDLSDRADDHLARGRVDHHAEAGCLGRRDEVVDPHPKRRPASSQKMVRQRAQPEEGPNEARAAEVPMSHVLPCARRIGRDVASGDLDQPGAGHQPGERARLLRAGLNVHWELPSQGTDRGHVTALARGAAPVPARPHAAENPHAGAGAHRCTPRRRGPGSPTGAIRPGEST